MPQQIIIAEQLRIAALLSNERVDELIVAQGRYQIGDVFLGTVENVLPSIDAAFVNIGESEKNGFIHVTDLGPLRQKKGAATITELLRPSQPVLVQVMKEPTGTKGPRLTGNLALPGRYLVLQPHGQGVNISRKINCESERNRLRALGVLIKPPGTGLLIRTEANDVSEELLINDLETLLKQWEAIQQVSEKADPPVLLNRDDDFIHRVLRDHKGENLSSIVVDNENALSRVNSFLEHDGLNVLVEAHQEPANILDHFRINASIRDALKPRVDLPSGGYIIIEPTEALTVIDVNSGSFTRSANARETVLWTNCEAAIEIARQLKLRNIGGVIIVDFIDMDSRRDQLHLLEHFTTAIRNDSARPQISQLTELGLVELTRKRQGQNIYELFGKECPNCGGIGHVGVLPGNDLLQPLAIEQGLVKSITSGKSDLSSSIDANNTRRKKGRGKITQESTQQEFDSSTETNLDCNIEQSERQEDVAQPEVNNSRQDPELIAVPMTKEQAQLFGWLGLNPTLLLDPLPENDNLLVKIVLPGEDSESILEEARQQIQEGSLRRRRRGRNSGKTTFRSNGDSSDESEETLKSNPTEIDSQKEELNVEITNLEDFEESEISLKVSETQSEQEPEDSRRRRRRSSAKV
ncbi:Rne/Rng family ribonuclease [Prochlorococcus sp. MIT 1341]|uniref:Rne/Rng family ribonuclease n=1 Tax=Prochlorococcus sp. MIT 1341 TaxID=3096221 RepID=UPI002A75D9A2|nr:Rne/Rng family ribonuclease [Prochlorococcus sp. MIT 1341]